MGQCTWTYFSWPFCSSPYPVQPLAGYRISLARRYFGNAYACVNWGCPLQEQMGLVDYSVPVQRDDSIRWVGPLGVALE